jgi:hypothetical protein
MTTITDVLSGINDFASDNGIATLLTDDQLVAWYVAARFTSDENVTAARESLTDVPDGGVDAVFVDEDLKTVYLVQGKRRTSRTHPETRGEVGELTRWASLLTGEATSFNTALGEVAPRTEELLRVARDRVKRRRFNLGLHFVTSGKGAPRMVGAQRELVAAASAGNAECVFEFVDHQRLLPIYEDYVYGIPSVPAVELEVNERYLRDDTSGVDMGIVMIPGDEIARIVIEHRNKIFARNIRGYYGDSNPVNEEIAEAGTVHPETFRYMNNGLTIVCDSMEFREPRGRTAVTLENPSIVNGQQTSITLSRLAKEKARRLQVVARIIVVDRRKSTGDAYNDFISQVVKATNFQTKVTIPDLYSNDWRQVELSRRFRRDGFFYARKTQRKGESRRQARGLPLVVRTELADAVGGCLEESLPYRLVKERLYDEERYEEIFNLERSTDEYLCMYYLWDAVRGAHRSGALSTERKRSQWLVLYYLHKSVGGKLLRNAESFIEAAAARGNSGADINVKLSRLIEATGAATERFYGKRAGKSGLPDDPTNFFKSPSLHGRFMSFLRHADGRTVGARVDKAHVALEKALN